MPGKKELLHLRQNLIYLISGGGAHAKFDEVIEDFPRELRGAKPKGFPHSAWMLLEHMRIAQWDILEFSRDSNHKSPTWPKGYWPKTDAPASPAAWTDSIEQFRDDKEEMIALIADEGTDLFAKIPWGDGQTILREALLVADHNAYHLAQIVDVRRLLKIWKE
jgi:hypothetical protein